MNEGKKLTLQMAIFFLIIFVTFGTIVIKEKKNTIFLPKIENSITNYISTNYSNLELKTGKVTEKENVFSMKVTNPNNKNHYFYITYSNKKITDTYQSDYLEGKTILDYLSKKLEKEIENTTNKKISVTFDNTLNNYSEKVQDQLLSEEINTLKVYTIEQELTIAWEENTITNKISDTITTLEQNDFTPKNYTIVVTNKDDITQSVKINNLKSSLINNDNLSTIISDIINDRTTDILKTNKITYEYLN